MVIYTLYQYTHRESGKRYIGVTNNIVRRHKQHTKGTSCARVFNKAVKKYGMAAFDFKVLALFDLVSAACYHEQAAILKFGSLVPNGYNCIAGAPFTRYAGPNKNALGTHQSTTARARQSIASRGNTYAKGCLRSVATRNKISAARKNQTPPMLGHHHSEATRKKMSVSQKGNQNAVGSHSNLGYIPSAKARFNMSVAQTRRRANERRII